MPAELVVEDGSVLTSRLVTTLTFRGDPPPLGSPVTTDTGSTLYGPSVFIASAIATQAAAQCIGVVIAISDVDLPNTRCRAVVQLGGIVTLTEEQWDAITGSSGGLNTSEAYFLDAPGTIADVAPSSPNWAAQVGVSLSPTQLLLSTPSAPIQI